MPTLSRGGGGDRGFTLTPALHNIFKNPNWQEADQLAIYKAWPRIWTQDYRETNPASDRVEALNPGPPEYNTSALNL